MLAEAPNTAAVLKPPLQVKARKKGGDCGNNQATFNFQLPEHVSSITLMERGRNLKVMRNKRQVNWPLDLSVKGIGRLSPRWRARDKEFDVWTVRRTWTF